MEGHCSPVGVGRHCILAEVHPEVGLLVGAEGERYIAEVEFHKVVWGTVEKASFGKVVVGPVGSNLVAVEDILFEGVPVDNLVGVAAAVLEGDCQYMAADYALDAPTVLRICG